MLEARITANSENAAMSLAENEFGGTAIDCYKNQDLPCYDDAYIVILKLDE